MIACSFGLYCQLHITYHNMYAVQVQLLDRVVVYEIDSDDQNDMMYHQKVIILRIIITQLFPE